MPIQVISTYKKIPPPPVDLTSAGADLFPVCDLVITLTANVDPILNIQGHTILWEQISGTPVILSNTDQLITTYAQITNDETDKEFRITIDKELADEQFDTVIVYATPTSLPTPSFPSHSNNGIPSDAVIDLNADTTASFPEPQNVIDNNVPIIPLFTINWSPPPDVVLQPFIVGYTLYENELPVATYNAGDTLEYNGSNVIYQVETHFVVNGMAPYQSSSERSFREDFANVQAPSTIVVDDMFPSSLSNLDVTITNFQNTVQRNEDVAPIAAYATGTTTFRYDINTARTEQTITSPGFANGTSIITRLDPGGIGGG